MTDQISKADIEAALAEGKRQQASRNGTAPSTPFGARWFWCFSRWRTLPKPR